MRFLIYEDAGEARLSQKMRQIWTPQIFNHFQGSCAGCSSRPPSSSTHLLEMLGAGVGKKRERKALRQALPDESSDKSAEMTFPCNSLNSPVIVEEGISTAGGLSPSLCREAAHRSPRGGLGSAVPDGHPHGHRSLLPSPGHPPARGRDDSRKAKAAALLPPVLWPWAPCHGRGLAPRPPACPASSRSQPGRYRSLRAALSCRRLCYDPSLNPISTPQAAVKTDPWSFSLLLCQCKPQERQTACSKDVFNALWLSRGSSVTIHSGSSVLLRGHQLLLSILPRSL